MSRLPDPAESSTLGHDSTERTKVRGGAASVAALRVDSVDAILLETIETLGVDAITIAVRISGNERVLVCSCDCGMREAKGTVSLGLVSSESNRLTGGVGLLQAVEARWLLGFTPNCYLAAPFIRTRHGVTGAIAAWNRRPRSWTVRDGTTLRRLAAHCESILEVEVAAL